jgi:hypothetical protein
MPAAFMMCDIAAIAHGADEIHPPSDGGLAQESIR